MNIFVAGGGGFHLSMLVFLIPEIRLSVFLIENGERTVPSRVIDFTFPPGTPPHTNISHVIRVVGFHVTIVL